MWCTLLEYIYGVMNILQKGVYLNCCTREESRKVHLKEEEYGCVWQFISVILTMQCNNTWFITDDFDKRSFFCRFLFLFLLVLLSVVYFVTCPVTYRLALKLKPQVNLKKIVTIMKYSELLYSVKIKLEDLYYFPDKISRKFDKRGAR